MVFSPATVRLEISDASLRFKEAARASLTPSSISAVAVNSPSLSALNDSRAAARTDSSRVPPTSKSPSLNSLASAKARKSSRRSTVAIPLSLDCVPAKEGARRRKHPADAPQNLWQYPHEDDEEHGDDNKNDERIKNRQQDRAHGYQVFDD